MENVHTFCPACGEVLPGHTQDCAATPKGFESLYLNTSLTKNPNVEFEEALRRFCYIARDDTAQVAEYRNARENLRAAHANAIKAAYEQGLDGDGVRCEQGHHPRLNTLLEGVRVCVACERDMAWDAEHRVWSEATDMINRLVIPGAGYDEALWKIEILRQFEHRAEKAGRK